MVGIQQLNLGWDYEDIKVEARRLCSILQSLGVKQIDLLK